MASTFDARIRELADQVGHGKLVGKVIVNQPYAASQEEGYWKTGPLAGVVIKHHPRGGQAKFLADPLKANFPRYFQDMAGQAFQVDGLVRAMHSSVEDLSGFVFQLAPREFEDLRNSAHSSVTDDGKVVFDRPPVRARLSKQALKEKGKLRRLGEGP